MRWTLLALSLSLAAAPAHARDGDEEACEGLLEGEDCARSDGDAGVCRADDSDPNVLVCDDDGLSPGSDDGSADDASDDSVDWSADCSTVDSRSLAGILFPLGALVIGRRRA